MKKNFSQWGVLLLIWILGLSGFTHAQDSYSNFNELTNRLQSLQSQNSDYAELQSLAKTSDGRDIWLLKIGSGDVENHPAVAVIGGAEGSHIIGSELAVKFAEQLLEGSEEREELLTSTTFYILPRVNPDATEQYFKALKFENDLNSTPANNDRDDTTNEDGYEDLNGDNLITLIRVEDETGKWMVHPKDGRLMKKADISKGEKGNYRVFSEGRDNDNDGDFNEDGEGGVNINKNFTFDFPYFEDGAGENMADQVETRAILDFLFEDAPNVYAVVSLGPANNLSTPLRFNRGDVSKRVITGWYEDDVAVNKMVSEKYNTRTSLQNAPEAVGQPGDLFQWAYFHYGRYSFSTPAWWIPDVKDEEGSIQKFEDEKTKFLAWADQNNVDAFVEWEEIDHPDFPNRKVEVGGIKPFAMKTPPYDQVDSLAKSHTDFIMELASMKPELQLVNLQREEAGRNLTRITVELYNNGILPTASRIGERTDWVRKIVVGINLSGNLELVSGEKQQVIDSIEGDGSLQKSWLVRGNGSFTITAGSPNTGISTVEQTIR